MTETFKENRLQGFLRRLSSRPILFFGLMTVVLFIATAGIDVILDRVQRGPNWSDFAALSVILGFAVLFLLSSLGFILSLIPWTRPFMRWLLCDFWFRLFSWQGVRWTLAALAIFATLIALFYTEENWRGKHAWERCKAELEAKGVVLDWNAYIPPPVPDDQNVFAVPKMQEWFVGRGATELSRRLENPLTPLKLSVQRQLAYLP